MEYFAIVVSLLALFISWRSYRDNSYQLNLAPYWDVDKSSDLHPKKSHIVVFVINSGGRNILIHAIGYATAERPFKDKWGESWERDYKTLVKFEEPALVAPNSRSEFNLLVDNEDDVGDLNRADGYVWVEDGSCHVYKRTIINSFSNKGMRKTKKCHPRVEY